ncbi:hypothetical protein KP509_1Z088300 [Ceratopteris richardii]|nr:hypothetical protein KP509_1Z267700 [Ceratopteris richardii]KAH6557881.1 hypothetical protein KP509_1Z088300 [Ceratopteris richardii]
METPAFLRASLHFIGWPGAQATTVRLHNGCSYTVCAKYWVTNSGSCPSGYYPGGPDETKACPSGSTDYDVYLCG